MVLRITEITIRSGNTDQTIIDSTPSDNSYLCGHRRGEMILSGNIRGALLPVAGQRVTIRMIVAGQKQGFRFKDNRPSRIPLFSRPPGPNTAGRDRNYTPSLSVIDIVRFTRDSCPEASIDSMTDRVDGPSRFQLRSPELSAERIVQTGWN